MRERLGKERAAQLKRMDEAATKIQAVTRGRQQRQKYVAQLHAKKLAEASDKVRNMPAKPASNGAIAIVH